MELEEIQSVWQDMSQKLDKQQQLTDQLIMEMTRSKYVNKFTTLSVIETTGSIVCFLMAITLLAYFGRLDTWYQQLCGVLAVLFLTVYPYLTLSAIYKIRKINISKDSLKETLVRFEKAKNQMLLIQRSGIIMSVFFTIISLVLATKIINDQDVFMIGSDKLWVLPGMIAFLVIFCLWGYRKYVRIINSAENLLKELEE